MTSGGNNFNYFPENQLTKFSAKCNFSYLLITRWFIKILLVDKTEMREILVMRRGSGRWLQNAGVSREMRETW